MMLMQPNAPLQPQAQPPMQPMQGLPPFRAPKQHHGSLVLAVFMTIAFVCALIFGIWAFSGMQENKSNLDAKIDAASEVAVKEAEEAKEVEFAERDKDPFRSYTGPATYGSLSFGYPKTWSVYLEEKESGTILDFYGHPFVIRGLGSDNSFAMRAQIVSSDFDNEADKFQKKAEKGTVAISAFRLEQVPSALGIRVTGEIEKDKQGIAVLLPIRDKTIKLWTESTEYTSDFDKVIQTTTFNP